MAARNPSAFDFTYDELALAPGELIKTTTPSIVADNQQFFRDKSQLVSAHCGHPLTTTSASLVELASIFVAFDHSGASDSASGGAAVTAAVYAWNSGANNFTVGLRYVNVYGGGNLDHTVTVSATQTTPLWRVIAADAVNGLIEADGTEQEIRLIASTTAGTLYYAGHLLRTVEL